MAIRLTLKQPKHRMESLVPIGWLQDNPMTAEDYEKLYLAKAEERIAQFKETKPERLEKLRRPCGFLNDEWEAMKKKMELGDMVQEFESPPKTWQQRRGRAGVALIRNGIAIHYVMLAVSWKNNHHLLGEAISKFSKLVTKLKRKGASDPSGLAAYIGRKKLGNRAFNARATRGRRKK